MAKIAILGAGAVGTALAQNWSAKGHKVTLGVRDPESKTAQEAANALGGAVEIVNFEASMDMADVIVLALPWDAVEPVTSQLSGWDGRIVIDATNPLGMSDDGFGLVIGHTNSGGEHVAALLPEARIVKSLNQIGAEMMADPSVLPIPPVMYVAGDDDDARHTVLGLIDDLGFDAQDFGALSGARLLEAFAMTWIHMAIMRDAGRSWGFARSTGTEDKQ